MVKLASMNSKVISYSIFLLRVNRGPTKTACLFMWIWYHLEFYPVVYSRPNLCLFSDVFGCVHPGLLVWPESGSSELLQPPRCLDQLGQPLNQLHPDQCGLPAQAPQVVLLALFPDNHDRCLSPPETKARIVYSFYSMGLWRVCSLSQIPDPEETPCCGKGDLAFSVTVRWEYMKQSGIMSEIYAPGTYFEEQETGDQKCQEDKFLVLPPLWQLLWQHPE